MGEQVELKMALSRRNLEISQLQSSIQDLEQDLVNVTSENKSLKRTVAMLKQPDENESQLRAMAEDVEKRIALINEVHAGEMAKLESRYDICNLLKEEAEKKLKSATADLYAKNKKIAKLADKIRVSRDQVKSSVSQTEALLSQEQEFKKRETYLQEQLDLVQAQLLDVTNTLYEVRQSKEQLSEQVFQERLEQEREEGLRRRLHESTEKRRTLEAQLSRLAVVEEREKALIAQVRDKNFHEESLQSRITHLEQLLTEKEDDFHKIRSLATDKEARMKEQIWELQRQNEAAKLQYGVQNIRQEMLHSYDDMNSTTSTLSDVGNVGMLENIQESMDSETMSFELSQSRPEAQAISRKKCRLSGWTQTSTSSTVQGTQTDLASNRKRSKICQTEHSCADAYTVNKPSSGKDDFPERSKTPRKSPRKDVSSTSTTRTLAAGDAETEVSLSRSANHVRSSSVKQVFEEDGMRVNVQVQVQLEPNELSEEINRDMEDASDEVFASNNQEWEHIEDDEECESFDERNAARRAAVRRAEDVLKKKMSTRRSNFMQTSLSEDIGEESRQRLEGHLNELEQAKGFLEARKGQLEDEVDRLRASVHQQRIRALDLKHELREKTGVLQLEVVTLREKLTVAEKELKDSKESSGNWHSRETALEGKLAKAREQVDSLRLEKRTQLAKLREDYDDAVADLRIYKVKAEERDKMESEAQRREDDLAKELSRVRLQLKDALPVKKEVSDRLRDLDEENAKLKAVRDRNDTELRDLRRNSERLEENNRKLMGLCTELEKQIQDMEDIQARYEENEGRWKSDKTTYERAVGEREDEVMKMQCALKMEKIGRRKAEEKVFELENLLGKAKQSLTNDIENLKMELTETKTGHRKHQEQSTTLERENLILKVELKKLRHEQQDIAAEIVNLKEERSALITKVAEYKANTARLSKKLEEQLERTEVLATARVDLENEMEILIASHNNEKYKLESTLAQQVKLIDYLQGKVEHPDKKKKGFFTLTRKDLNASELHVRELHNSLRQERDKNAELNSQLRKLRDEVYRPRADSLATPNTKTRSEIAVEKSSSFKSKVTTLGPEARSTMATLALSPQFQPSPVNSPGAVLDKKPASAPKAKRERMHHNIPHRFTTGLNSRATKCAVCLGSVHFVKQAAKCQECSVVCHPKCAASLPATCGLPTEYAQHFTDVMTRVHSHPGKPGLSRTSVADLKLHLYGWLKIPKPGKQVWEKKWIVLDNNSLHVYNDNSKESPLLEDFALTPSNGTVTVHSAVTAAELKNTASQDLPYILRLEFEPNTTCWPGRSLYLMALNFSEKQLWVATLEAIVEDVNASIKIKDAKLLGNSLLTLANNDRIEINSMLAVNAQMLLIGADEGLFVSSLDSGGQSSVTPLDGVVGGVFQMALIRSVSIVVMISGTKDRQLVCVKLSSLQKLSPGQADPHVPSTSVQGAAACTTFAIGECKDGVYLCVATAEKVLLLKYNSGLDNFFIKKEFATKQACSCMHFGRNSVIFGSDKFYVIDINTYTIAELLDQQDSTLSFAVYGAAHYDSFPIAVLLVSSANKADEYLLCFHEFGVFVDGSGKRSRNVDLKWSGLPLAFAFEAPYLYMIQFNALQVITIHPAHYPEPQGSKVVLVLPCPRYLGPAATAGAVYIGSSHEGVAEVLCFKGNALLRQVEQPTKERKSPRKHQSVCSPSYESGYGSPESKPASPTVIKSLSASPGMRTNRLYPSISHLDVGTDWTYPRPVRDIDSDDCTIVTPLSSANTSPLKSPRR